MSSETNSANRGRKTRGGWIVILFVGVVLVPVVWNGWEPEVARWRAAAAIETYETGDRQAAIDLLREVAGEEPENAFLRLQLAEWLWETRRPEEAKRVLDQDQRLIDVSVRKANAGQRRLAMQYLELNARVLIALDRPEEALAAMKQYESWLEEEPYSQVTWINNFAYFRAVAGLDLPQARREMQGLLESRESLRFGSTDARLSYRGSALAACGLVANVLDQPDQVLDLLAEEIDYLELEIEARVADDRDRTFADFARKMWPPSLLGELLTGEDEMRRLQDELRICYLIRALLLDRSGNSDEAMALRRKLKELGGDEEQLLAGLPDDLTAFSMVTEAAMFMDTYGWIRFRQNQLNEAIDYIDVAVTAGKLVLEASRSNLFTVPSAGVDWNAERSALTKSLATLRKHRWEIFSKRGQSGLAESEAQAIRELGFELDDPVLF